MGNRVVQLTLTVLFTTASVHYVYQETTAL